MHHRRGASFVALTLVASLGSACKGNSQLSSFPATTQPPAVRVLENPAAIAENIPAPTKLALAARAVGHAVSVYASPGAATAQKTFTNPTIEGQPLAFLAVDQQADWLQVRLPERPNGVTAWVKAADLQLAPVDNRVVISVGRRNLRVLDKDQQLMFETNVAVGKPSTPTPLGRFYVDVWLPNPGNPYGAFLLSIGGFSEVLRSFGGGRGQIAMHGWHDQSVMGQAASNGCVRMRNSDINRVATLAPLATPVEIIP